MKKMDSSQIIGIIFLSICVLMVIYVTITETLRLEEKPVQSIEIIFKDPKTFYRRDTLVIVESIKTDSTLFLVTDENTSITIKY